MRNVQKYQQICTIVLNAIKIIYINTNINKLLCTIDITDNTNIFPISVNSFCELTQHDDNGLMNRVFYHFGCMKTYNITTY